MKICHVIYIPRFSGAEVLVSNLARKHIPEGHQISIVAIMPPDQSFAIAQQELASIGVMLNFPDRGLNQWQRLQFLIQAFKQFAPDVVFAHAVIPSFYARYAVLAGLRKIPVVSVLHDGSQDDYASDYFRLFERWLAPLPAGIVSVSETSAENYQRRIRSKIKPQTIANGIQLEAFLAPKCDRAEVRKKIFNADDQQIVFLQVGRIASTKQQHHSLAAFSEALKRFNVLGKLCFVGISQDPAYEADLKQQVDRLGLTGQVLFLGVRSDIPALLAAADIYLMPSLIEAHSVAFIEALASGITVIASEIEPFQFGTAFSGVHLISPHQVDEFVQCIGDVVQAGAMRRWQRDLSEYSICKTANAYLELSKALVPVG
ncbi:glycosyl transferase, group 1 [Leptolyngbya sp. NIES-3755]|nr:glycosyl transferase, group 1 [Leptolyngbya sp. NIES-3755]